LPENSGKDSKALSNLKIILERDKSYKKCLHAIKVIIERKVSKIMPTSNPYELPRHKELIEQYTLGFVPTDISFNLA
jgi:hypothetical protein